MLHFFLATIGIMCAIPEEADSILNSMTEKKSIILGKREFVQGNFEGTSVVFSLAGIGKVSAATTATLLVNNFKVDELIFTGVAGGSEKTNIGDVVVGSAFLQHDLDLRPIFSQFYIHSLDAQVLQADQSRVSKMKSAATRFLNKDITFPEFDIFTPKAHEGAIVSGDQFIANLSHHQSIVNQTKTILKGGFLAIEMEGAAVAQVCTELEVPFIILRTISDKANDSAAVDFPRFIDQVARKYSFGILKEYFQEINASVKI